MSWHIHLRQKWLNLNLFYSYYYNDTLSGCLILLSKRVVIVFLLLSASGIFSGGRWYHGRISDSKRSALLVQEGEAWYTDTAVSVVSWLRFIYLYPVVPSLWSETHLFVFKDGIGLDAINDSFLLEGSIYRLLRRHCRDQPYYVHLLELFTEVL